jgi:16S rRNA (adenine1518-N6/adenine1519-N6)-dimethyltransferase
MRFAGKDEHVSSQCAGLRATGYFGILRVDRYPEPQIPIGLLPTFFRLVKAGFSQKRKTLRNSLAGGMRWKPAQSEAILYQSGINSMRRAETLSLEEWGELADIVNKLENEATMK